MGITPPTGRERSGDDRCWQVAPTWRVHARVCDRPPHAILSGDRRKQRRAFSEMQVRDGMSKVVLTVGPGHTLREASRQMAKRGVGAAVVIDPEGEGPGIITERDVLISIGKGEDPDSEQVCDHLTSDVGYARSEER